jgi:hypothetical protein
VNQSKLAKKLKLKSLPRFLMSQWTASTTAGLRYSFIKEQIASRQLRTVVMVPGVIRIRTDALEDWYETIPQEVLADNKVSYPIRIRVLWLKSDAYNWLQRYAHAITTHAVKTGYLVREPCAFCGNPESQAHHPSYDTPLRVVWLCKKCHPLHHHRQWTALKLIAETGRPAQLELFPRSWLLNPKVAIREYGRATD